MPDDITIVRRFYTTFAANDMAEVDAIRSPDWRPEPPLGVYQHLLAAGGQPIAEERAA